MASAASTVAREHPVKSMVRLCPPPPPPPFLPLSLSLSLSLPEMLHGTFVPRAGGGGGGGFCLFLAITA